ncbi:hypothetical protein M758_8G010700 [Ceratodon purpureus]|uniref:Protein kinase domain-containing protein n=1 Tax=Ceratodon purpureus TaxID=3225 RepID=A0A8T0H266_CERPU|nr:hypothetical protein KC19_8G011400 [Ceratodon purpureus]KAG0607224.1 hypothetical protein M758_8G010700 [Ceratodon purpureus]
MSTTEESRLWTEVQPSNRHERLSEVRERVIQDGLLFFDRADFTIGRKIGEGGQGTIYEATSYSNMGSKPLSGVVKKFKPLEGVSQGYCIPQEKTMHFVNVCKPFGFFFDHDDSLCMFMPRYSTDLRTLIDSQVRLDGAPFSEEVAVSIITKLAIGLKALHGVGIYHRDIKAANILVDPRPNRKHIHYPEIYITDFENSPQVVGTKFWRAPEILQTLHVCYKKRAPLSAKQLQAADVYSFGMTCYEILTGKTPFGDHPWSDYNLVLSGGRPELPCHVPEFLKNLIHQCWHQDLDARPSFAEIVALLQESNSLARDMVSMLEMGEKQGEASIKWLEASPEACLVELKRTLLPPEMLHTAEFDTVPANAKLERVIPEFISTCEEFESKFGWDSHHRHPSLPFVDYVERTRLLTLIKHLYKLHVDGLVAIADETIHHHDRLMESNCDVSVQLLFTSLCGHRMYLLRRILTSILEDAEERELSESEVTYLDKFAIVRAFIKSLVDAGVSRRTAASEVADIGARLYKLQIESYGELRDRFLVRWYLMAMFYPFFDTLWGVCSRVFIAILLYLGYKISAVSGLSNFLFGYTRYSISGFHEVLLCYVALSEGLGFALFNYILWKVWGWKGIFSCLIVSIAFLNLKNILRWISSVGRNNRVHSD